MQGSFEAANDRYLMGPYDSALQEILDEGVARTNERTKQKTLSVFGMMRKYRLDTPRFPVVTRRKVWPKSVFAELVWFLSGSTNNNDLKSLGCNFWTPWVDHAFEEKHGYADGSFGPVYGFQLRHFGGRYGDGLAAPESGYGDGGFDQLKWVVDRIKEDHSCRRTLWSLWNPKDVSSMKLPPCHLLSQILVDDDRNLSLIMYQRSCDMFIGVPANVMFYSALTVMLAQQTGCRPRQFIHFMADAHVYADQMDAVREYLSRRETPDSPRLEVRKAADIFSYRPEDFVLSDYSPLDKIDCPVAV